MSWISLLLWIITMTIYFLSLRVIIIDSNDDMYIDNMKDAILVIILGIIPILNIIFLISIVFDYIESKKSVTGIKLLKKILFIKDKEVDDRWR